jgi:hypothetical protein
LVARAYVDDNFFVAGRVVRGGVGEYTRGVGEVSSPWPRRFCGISIRTTQKVARFSMNSTEMMRREILRLAGATQRSAFISVKRLSAFYNVSEVGVLSELTKLADEKRIRLSGWDGKEVRPMAEWRNKDEFVERAPAGVPVRVELVEESGVLAKAAGA